MTEEPDVYKRRRIMKDLAEGKFTPEGIAFLTSSAETMQSVYGNLETISREDASSGRMLEASCHGETRQYFVPRDSAWINAKRLRIDKAYRIFEQDDTTLIVREVQNSLELQVIQKGYLQEISRILTEIKKNKRNEK